MNKIKGGHGVKNGKLAKSIEVVAAPWKESAYYDEAEKWIHVFWGPGVIFSELFEKLDLTRTVELAVGHGRHAEIVGKIATELTVMDVFEENLDVCRERLSGFENVSFRKCEGASFDGIDSGWATAIYCYDAMVHFSPDIVESYLMDTSRILRVGGRALYHHSNFLPDTDQHYGLNPHARNNMSKDKFVGLSKKAGLRVLQSTVLDWGGVEKLDCVTLLEKP